MTYISDHPKFFLNCVSALFAVAAAILWIRSARAEVWADGQASPRRDNIVIDLDGRLYDVSGTAREAARWSSYAAYAAAIAAIFQALVAVL
jgi:hypothetical protein